MSSEIPGGWEAVLHWLFTLVKRWETKWREQAHLLERQRLHYQGELCRQERLHQEELASQKSITLSLAERVAAQSELLARRSQKRTLS